MLREWTAILTEYVTHTPETKAYFTLASKLRYSTAPRKKLINLVQMDQHIHQADEVDLRPVPSVASGTGSWPALRPFYAPKAAHTDLSEETKTEIFGLATVATQENRASQPHQMSFWPRFDTTPSAAHAKKQNVNAQLRYHDMSDTCHRVIRRDVAALRALILYPDDPIHATLRQWVNDEYIRATHMGKLANNLTLIESVRMFFGHCSGDDDGSDAHRISMFVPVVADVVLALVDMDFNTDVPSDVPPWADLALTITDLVQNQSDNNHESKEFVWPPSCVMLTAPDEDILTKWVNNNQGNEGMIHHNNVWYRVITPATRDAPEAEDVQDALYRALQFDTPESARHVVHTHGWSVLTLTLILAQSLSLWVS